MGDPNATVHSFGMNDVGNVGSVDDSTPGFSSDTYASDKAFWVGLGGSGSSASDALLLSGPVSQVDSLAQSLVENQDYSAIAGPFGANSNSASQAIANRNAGYATPVPGRRLAPGSGSWREIEFR